MAPEIDGKVYINDIVGKNGQAFPDTHETTDELPQAGDLVRMAITEAHDYDLVATVVETVQSGKQNVATASGLPAYATIASGAAQRFPPERRCEFYNDPRDAV